MKRYTFPFQNLTKGFFILLLACLALQATGFTSTAAPLRDEPPPQIPLVCSTGISHEYCDLQVVLLIDDTGSMRSNDPMHMRNQGAKNLVDILAQEYYQPALDAQALDPTVVLPDIKVAVIHFSHCISKNPDDKCSSDVKFNSGWLPITAKDQLYQDIDWLNTQPLFYRIFQYTSFPEPFQAAVNLFNSPEAASKKDCVKRLTLLLTDGTPENQAGPLGEPALGQQMNQVKDILKDYLADTQNHAYVTAFKVVKKYWDTNEPYWQDIAGAENVSLEKSLDEVASRMEKIAAPNIGVQSYTLSPSADNPKLYQITVLPHLVSLRITYYKLDPTSTLSFADPQGNPVMPDGDKVKQSGADTSIEVWTLTGPPAGTYQIHTSLQGGIITAIPLYAVSVQVDSPTTAQPLVQFMDGQIHLKLLDGQGQPVLPADNPAYTLDVQASLTNEAGESALLSITEDAQGYQSVWIPPSAGRQLIHIRAELTDANQNVAWRCEGDAGEITVNPVTVKADLSSECAPANTALTVPLQFTDANTGQSAGSSNPIEWQTSSVTVKSNAKVDSSVQALDAKAGTYQLKLTPRLGEDIQTHLTASMTLSGKSVQVYAGDITTKVCALPTPSPAPSPSPTPVPPPPPPPAAKCGPSMGYLPWLLILLIVLLLTWPLVRRRSEEDRFPFWFVLILLVILLVLLDWILWYCNFPSLPLWILLLILAGILLIWFITWLICHFVNPLRGVIG
ncbi:MAG TPA: vWA domain-containing protein, partial [Anaerolineales bacterium]|nr:vWA domain-containing protein [Anaerolineales bacterium]